MRCLVLNFRQVETVTFKKQQIKHEIRNRSVPHPKLWFKKNNSVYRTRKLLICGSQRVKNT